MVLFQGLENEYQEEGQLLGQFTYDQEGESLQMFSAPVRILGFTQASGSRVSSLLPASTGPANTHENAHGV